MCIVYSTQNAMLIKLYQMFQLQLQTECRTITQNLESNLDGDPDRRLSDASITVTDRMQTNYALEINLE